MKIWTEQIHPRPKHLNLLNMTWPRSAKTTDPKATDKLPSNDPSSDTAQFPCSGQNRPDLWHPEQRTPTWQRLLPVLTVMETPVSCVTHGPVKAATQPGMFLKYCPEALQEFRKVQTHLHHLSCVEVMEADVGLDLCWAAWMHKIK